MSYRQRHSTAGVIFLLFALFACQSALAAEPKRVMVLHSFGREVRPWSDYAQSIRSELQRQSPWPLDITDHSLISARSDDDVSERPFIEYLRALFAKRPIDLIVTVGAPAAGFVQRHREQLFAATPMVFTAVEQRRIQYSSLTASDTVVPIRIDFPALMANILQVLPETKNVQVIVGTSPIEQFWGEEIRKAAMPFADRVAFTFYDDLSFEEILKHVAAPPPHSVIFWESMIVDAAGVVHDGDAAFKRLHAAAKAPIFGYYEPNIGEGLVGGPYAAVLDTSRQTAAVAVRILSGENAGDIRITPIEFATPKFDWREMQRWGISESRLPPGSEIYFREPTTWEQYRWQIMLVAVALLGQSLLIAGLFYERRGRRHAELEARQRLSELAHMNRTAAAGEMTASIAHELNQPLTAILSNAEAAHDLLGRKNVDIEKIQEIVADIIEEDTRASEVMNRIRRLLRKGESKPEIINLNQLVNSTLHLLRGELVKQKANVELTLASDSLMTSGDPIQLQQVLLNAIMNAMEAMNANAPSQRILQVMTRANGNKIEAAIVDCGHGIAAEHQTQLFKPFFTTKSHGLGLGLSICSKIVKAHGGELSIENNVGNGGAKVTITLPAHDTILVPA
jgi:signal transduction histidine kinase